MSLKSLNSGFSDSIASCVKVGKIAMGTQAAFSNVSLNTESIDSSIVAVNTQLSAAQAGPFPGLPADIQTTLVTEITDVLTDLQEIRTIVEDTPAEVGAIATPGA